MLKDQLKKDNWLRLCFGVAKELGMTLMQLRNTTTDAEIMGWSAYFSLLNEEQEKQMKAGRRGRR